MIVSDSGSFNTWSVFVLAFLIVGHCVDTAPQVSYKDVSFAQKYLKQFHYFSPLRDGNHNWKTALRTFQRYMHLPVTGELNALTLNEMHKPRCGVPDIDDEIDFSLIPGVKSKRYQVTAEKWNKTSLTYAFESKGDDLPASTVQAIFQKAFKLWSDPSSLTFTEITDTNTADIKIKFAKGSHSPCSYSFDQQGGVLAHAFFPKSGIIHFDDDETFTDNVPSGTNLLSVAAHEIGHVLGLHHSNQPESLMNAEYQGFVDNLALHTDDVNGIQFLYGSGSGSAAAPSTGSSCSDKMSSCKTYSFLCSTTGTMKTNCAKTCGFCGSASVVDPNCIDVKSRSDCNSLKALKLCTSFNKQHRRLMIKYCKKTCNFCGSG